jgi:MFS family permease
VTTVDLHAPATNQERRLHAGFWIVAYAFLIVMAFSTLPSPLYGLYRVRDHLSSLMITVIYGIFAASTIATLLVVQPIAARIGRRGVMISAIVTMMVAAAVLAAWKALPGLLIGRLITGAASGLAAGTAITYLLELRLRADPKAPIGRARTIGTSVNVGANGVGPLLAGLLAQWGKLQLTLPYLVILGLGAIALAGLWVVPETGAPMPHPPTHPEIHPTGPRTGLTELVRI